MEDFFNEENYLIRQSKESLDMIEEKRLGRLNELEKERDLYNSVKHEYEIFLDMIADLLKSLGFSNSLEYSLAISYLIHRGYLSYNGQVDLKKTYYEIELASNLGLNIIMGEGCCRNYSQFHKDIMDRLELFSKKFYCISSSVRLKKKSFYERASHVANLIDYNGKLYVFDCFNKGILYNFVSSYEAFIISHTAYHYLTYKPYFELIFDENDIEGIKKQYHIFKDDSKERHLSAFEWHEMIKGDVMFNLVNKNRLFEEFSNDTCNIKNSINNTLKMSLK